jgi:hypothetical protein
MRMSACPGSTAIRFLESVFVLNKIHILENETCISRPCQNARIPQLCYTGCTELEERTRWVHFKGDEIHEKNSAAMNDPDHRASCVYTTDPPLLTF